MQRETLGHRGRAGDPLCGIRLIMRCGRERLTDRQQACLAGAMAADERHDEVDIAWHTAQELRSAFHSTDLTAGRRIAEYVLASFPSCPTPEIARLGRICASGASRSGVLRHRRTSESPEASGISTTTGSGCSLIGEAFTDPRLA